MIEVVGVLVAGSFDFRLLQQYRHETDMSITLRHVRFQGQSGKHMLALSFSGFDPTRTWTPMLAGGSVAVMMQITAGRLNALAPDRTLR